MKRTSSVSSSVSSLLTLAVVCFCLQAASAAVKAEVDQDLPSTTTTTTEGPLFGPNKLSYHDWCTTTLQRTKEDCSQRMDENSLERAMKNRKFLTKKGRQGLLEEEMERRRQLRKQQEQDGQQQAPLPTPPLRNLQVSNDAPRFQSFGSVFNVLVVLVQWENHAGRMGTVPKSSYEYLFNGQGADPTLAPYGTVRDWFDEMSHGQFQVSFTVTDWTVATGYTEQSFTGDGSQGRNSQLAEAFTPVLQQVESTGTISFGDFDQDFDRNIDLTVFIHSGYEGLLPDADCDNGIAGAQRIASHSRWSLSASSSFMSNSGYGLSSYAVAPAFRGTCNTEINRIGLIVHEMIHPFAIPDLYDVEGPAPGGTGLGGIDGYDTMANSQGQVFDLALPGSLSAWTKYKLGWLAPTPITADGTYTLRPSSQFADAFIINTGYQLNEYLLIENRQPIAGTFDEKFYAGGGISVYHIDENIWTVFSLSGGDGIGEGNYPRGGPFLGSEWPGNNKHYPVALLQADGLYELEQALNGGHAADLYNQASQSLGPGNGNTYPNTDSYAFGVVQSTGITLSNFQTDGTTMTFDVSGLGGTGGGGASGPSDPAPVSSPTASPVTAAPQPAPASVPTELVNEPPTPQPTNAPRPTPRPTQVPAPPKPSPTAAPVEGTPPAPTPAPEPTAPPGPQECSSAVEISLTDTSPIEGSFTAAVGRTAPIESCDTTQPLIGGWYKVVGNAKGLITAEVCITRRSGDAKISVFEGDCSGELTCVESQVGQVPRCPFGNGVSWSAEADKVYHILVTGSTERPYALRMFDQQTMTNQQCSDAVSYINSDVTGNTVGTTVVSETCYGDQLPGVWYKIPSGRLTSADGKNYVFNANTCFQQTSFYNTVSIFRGGCGSLECVDATRISCQNGEIGQSVFWTTNTDEEFYMFVHADESVIGFDNLHMGNFRLGLKGFLEKPNDKCPGALPIIIDGSTVITGNTRGSTPDASFDAPCGVETAGVWYKITGTGTPGSALQATTCLEGTKTPTNIHVFSGSCGNLQCVGIEGGNYAACTGQSDSVAADSATVNWRSEPGKEYYVLVGSRDGSDGAFELQIREFAPRANDDCDRAESIVLGDGVTTTTTQSTPDFTYGETCGAPLDTSGLWYQVEGTGKGIEVSTCADNDYNSAISVFTGSACAGGNRTCLAGSAVRDPLCDYQGVTVGWLSEEGETYFVYVHGSPLNSMGTFVMWTEEFNVTEPNEFCQQAIQIDPDGSPILGSTENATHGAGIAECGVEIQHPGLWYSFEGTGNPFEVSACNSDNENDIFDVSTSIFAGKSCGEASCATGATFSGQFCLPEGESSGRRFLQTEGKQKLVLDSVPGELYYVYVHGQNPSESEGGGIGEYELYIQEIVPETMSPTESPTNAAPGEGDSGGDSGNNNALYSLLIFLLLIPLAWYFREGIFACCSGLRRKDQSEENDAINNKVNDTHDYADDEIGSDEDDEHEQSSQRSMMDDGYEDE
mmetsp:Transcript_59839/g.146965  ORF Transcript_59839/g.146965 Transcript_59839/m.146965 type:complete len:1491 (-) Transcript_59839:2223-6695(-)